MAAVCGPRYQWRVCLAGAAPEMRLYCFGGVAAGRKKLWNGGGCDGFGPVCGSGDVFVLL